MAIVYLWRQFGKDWTGIWWCTRILLCTASAASLTNTNGRSKQYTSLSIFSPSSPKSREATPLLCTLGPASTAFSFHHGFFLLSIMPWSTPHLSLLSCLGTQIRHSNIQTFHWCRLHKVKPRSTKHVSTSYMDSLGYRLCIWLIFETLLEFNVFCDIAVGRF